jgi:uncharacterized SAM-dependent methyltransferase
LGETAFNLDDWRVIGEYVYDGEGGRHQAFYSPIRDVRIQDIQIKAGERVQVEQSLKYSSEDAQHMWKMSGVTEVKKWSATSEAYSKYSCQLFLHLSFCGPYGYCPMVGPHKFEALCCVFSD